MDSELDIIVEELADKLGIYGTTCNSDFEKEPCPDNPYEMCRICFANEMTRKIKQCTLSLTG